MIPSLYPQQRIWQPDRKPLYSPHIQYIKGHPLGPDGGLIAHWLMNEAGGNTLFDIAGLNHAPLVNGPEWTAGKFGGPAVELDGSAQYIDAGGTDDFQGYSGITVAVWVTGAWDGSVDCFASKFWDGANRSWYLYWDSQVIFRCSTDTQNDNDAAASGAAAFSAGVWYSIVGTWSSSDGQIRLYVNGVEASGSPTAQAGNTVRTNTAPPLIGANDEGGGPAEHWDGLVDNVAIYSRGLNAAEVMKLSETPFIMLEPLDLPMWYVAPELAYVPKAIMVM